MLKEGLDGNRDSKVNELMLIHVNRREQQRHWGEKPFHVNVKV